MTDAGRAVTLNLTVARMTAALDEAGQAVVAMQQQIEQLRQEATVLAGLHCHREGGTWNLTHEMLAALPLHFEIEMEAMPHGRQYRLVAVAQTATPPSPSEPASPG